eukprot:4433034-Karenia_brevis.AAC.1
MIAEWTRSGGSEDLQIKLRYSLSSLCHLIAKAEPRVIGPVSHDPPVLIFTDGACEDVVTIGAVMILPEGQVEVFGAEVAPGTVQTWKKLPSQVQVIGQAELFPLLVARLTWAQHIRGKRVVFFIDNEAARIGAVRGYSPSLPSLKVICQMSAWDYVNGVRPWYARVPTESNIADEPSRLRLSNPLFDTARCVVPVFPSGESFTQILSMGNRRE